MPASREGDYLDALELLTADPESPTVQGIGDEGRRLVAEAQAWIAGPTVVGTGVTFKQVKGTTDRDQLSLVVYVTEKLPERVLDTAQRVPSSVALPGRGDEPIVTDVVPIGVVVPEVNTGKTRPLTPGYSVGGISDGPGTGTIGCYVSSVDDPDTPLILSNSHVLARHGVAPMGTPIVQPGHADGGGEAEVVGALVAAVPFDFNPGYNQLCDAAVASLGTDQDPDLAIPGIGVPTYDRAVVVEPGLQVQKNGRTTGHTVGVVRDVHFRARLKHPKPGGGEGYVGFTEQVLCSRYTAGGDSGSLVCDMAGRAVGLHWGGSSSSSIFTPITFVFDELGITLARPRATAGA